ncbi:hypothetical protein AKJ16_DCAP25871 [Drosera capensis]
MAPCTSMASSIASGNLSNSRETAVRSIVMLNMNGAPFASEKNPVVDCIDIVIPVIFPMSSALAFSFLCIAEQKNDDWYWRCLSLRIIDPGGWPIPLLGQPLVWARKACGQFPYNLKSGLSFTVLTNHANIFISCDHTLPLFTRLAQNFNQKLSLGRNGMC